MPSTLLQRQAPGWDKHGWTGKPLRAEQAEMHDREQVKSGCVCSFGSQTARSEYMPSSC